MRASGPAPSGVAQSAEHSAVNRRVVGSSPTPGASSVRRFSFQSGNWGVFPSHGSEVLGWVAVKLWQRRRRAARQRPRGRFADSDSTGMNNWQKWVAGLIPSNSASVLQMASPTNSGSNIVVTWQSVTNINYFLQRSASLTPGSFQTVRDQHPRLFGHDLLHRHQRPCTRPVVLPRRRALTALRSALPAQMLQHRAAGWRKPRKLVPKFHLRRLKQRQPGHPPVRFGKNPQPSQIQQGKRRCRFDVPPGLRNSVLPRRFEPWIPSAVSLTRMSRLPLPPAGSKSAPSARCRAETTASQPETHTAAESSPQMRDTPPHQEEKTAGAPPPDTPFRWLPRISAMSSAPNCAAPRRQSIRKIRKPGAGHGQATSSRRSRRSKSRPERRIGAAVPKAPPPGCGASKNRRRAP